MIVINNTWTLDILAFHTTHLEKQVSCSKRICTGKTRHQYAYLNFWLWGNSAELVEFKIWLKSFIFHYIQHYSCMSFLLLYTSSGYWTMFGLHWQKLTGLWALEWTTHAHWCEHTYSKMNSAYALFRHQYW